jgi:pimeloyl-ACP methyl ester carboxylesterase
MTDKGLSSCDALLTQRPSERNTRREPLEPVAKKAGTLYEYPPAGKKGASMKPLRVFIHGLESSSQGTKGVYFSEKFPDMLIEDYTGLLEKRMAKLRNLLAGKKDIILVGSSFGGLMAAIYACENEENVRRLILLAPALDLGYFKPYTERRLEIPVWLYHGKEDDVVPPVPVEKIARKVFSNLSYHLVDDDHSLHRTFPDMEWDRLLSA